jgi:hypothetical protein
MGRHAVREPSSRQVQAALRRTTEHLARELAAPLAGPPDWSQLEWRMACASAAIHGAAPLLSSCLRWQGPSFWQSFLAQQRAHSRTRHGRLMHLLSELGVRFAQAGVAAVPLKGAALQALGIYAPGERPMADLDVLVREADREHAVTVLQGLGLTAQERSWKEQVFASASTAPADALGEHGGRAIKVELHTGICERLPWEVTDITPQMFPPDARPGLNAYPSRAALLTHLLIHAAGSMITRTLRLMHLNDLAQLGGQMSTGDWCALLDLVTQPRREGPWWALPPLLLTQRYYGQIVPQPVLEELRGRCRWLLAACSRRQRLSDVSHTRMQMEAFPGLEWSRSLPAAAAYIRARIRPDPVALRARSEIHTRTEWGLDSRWCRLSQRQRMLHWLMHRPMRPPSLHCVRAALAQA